MTEKIVVKVSAETTAALASEAQRRGYYNSLFVAGGPHSRMVVCGTFARIWVVGEADDPQLQQTHSLHVASSLFMKRNS